MKKLGLMGCGKVAEYGHLPMLKQVEQLELTALFDPDLDRASQMAEKFDAPFCTDDCQAFLARDIDAVAITSPAPAHLPNVAAAAAAGKGILCEKPLAMSAEQAEQMKRICDQAGVKLYTAFDYRFSPVAQTIHRLINEGAIGRVGCLRLIYIWNLHGRYIFENGRKIPQPRRVGRMEEGGPMVDCGVHQIDLARWWTGSEVTAIHAAGAWVEHFHAPDHVWLHMEHENAAHTTVEMSFSYCADVAEPIARFSYELIGTDGLIRYDKREQVFEIRTAEGTRQLEFGHEKNFRGMYEAFAVALETGQDAALPTAHDGAEAVRISREATEMVIASRRR